MLGYRNLIEGNQVPVCDKRERYFKFRLVWIGTSSMVFEKENTHLKVFF